MKTLNRIMDALPLIGAALLVAFCVLVLKGKAL